MSAPIGRLPFPPGLPIGDGWDVSAPTAPVIFPFDGTVVARAPVGSVPHAKRALDAAVDAEAATAALPSHVRRVVLSEAAARITRTRQAFEDLLVLETGKPLVDCRTEVSRTIVTLQSAAEEVARIHGETVPLDLLPSGEGLFGFWTRVPIGVVIGITGFNYPLLLAAHKVAPSLAAGCPVICKPAPQTPLATLWLADILRRALTDAGCSPASVQVVTGGADVGAALTTDSRIGAVSFTGSAAVGHRIARDAAPTKTLLELGSNSALLVCSDADLDAAADAVVRGGFYASGQACISVQRVVVLEDVIEPFTERLTTAMKDVSVGDPRDAATRVSSLIVPSAAARVEQWIERAVHDGAQVLYRGEGRASTVAPTVLTNVEETCDVWREEVFGPVVCLRSVSSVEEGFETLNRSRYGLHASIYTSSLAVAFDALRRCKVGGVVVNEVPGFRADNMPYGGVKDSGSGREGPRFAIEELTVTRMAVIRPGSVS
ncbi:MAG: aldehyde dehydrogenase family protein [Actinomycetota bacterium]|nr:aldehyde dehydrogenase family protein [Actinomycetota bacterium]